MSSPILWQNAEQTTVLLDIPRSIAHAQGTFQHPCPDHLLTSPPLEASSPTNEPKSEKARTHLQGNTVDEQLDGEYLDLVQNAVTEIRKGHVGSWCSPRPFVEEGRKRKRCNEDCEDSEQSGGAVGTSNAAVSRTLHVPHRPEVSVWSAQELPPGLSIHGEGLIANDSEEQVAFSMGPAHDPSVSHYRIPAKASFYVGDCKQSRAFRGAVRTYAEHMDTKRTFDFILLDPPWPNRSVKRTHKTANSTYHIAGNLPGISDLLFGMDLDMLMSKDAFVGIWITNKPAVRELVLGDDGLFATWGVQLIEEWIWLKTTIHGEPMTPLDAMWRKPYEVMLLGKKQQQVPEAVERRVIVAVPDLHSRKPCLKELIESRLHGTDYRGLELFARHLVAGWTSWGDECIKFNEEKRWRKGGLSCHRALEP